MSGHFISLIDFAINLQTYLFFPPHLSNCTNQLPAVQLKVPDAPGATCPQRHAFQALFCLALFLCTFLLFVV